jgi:hypothetical protein
MIQKHGGVLKKTKVRAAGAARIGPAPFGGPDRADAPEGQPPGPAQDAAAAHRPEETAQARIIRQEDGLAIVEITCACGRTIQLQCQYAT